MGLARNFPNDSIVASVSYRGSWNRWTRILCYGHATDRQQLVVGQVLAVNPAAAVRGPKYVVKTGKTPVLTATEARQLLDSIDTKTVVGLRDRALIGLLVFTFARIGARSA